VRFPAGLGKTGPARPVWRAVDLVQDLVAPSSEEILFLHRKTFPPPLARLLARPPRRIVFDFDDAVDLPPPSVEEDPRLQERYRANFEATTRRADLVICGNRHLAERVPHDRWEIVPTPIDTVRFRPGAAGTPEPRTLGWVGHADNLPYLERLAGPLLELAKRHPGLRLIVVADRPPDLPGLDVEYRRWTLETELACFAGIGVGLMPLADTPWARGKCAFKAIQYMALGVPAVISPVGMNRELVSDGENGFLAETDEDWVRAIDRILGDPALAGRVADAGRRTVRDGYALDVTARRLAGILRGLTGPGRA
jgi:glycosyltransferase involved in cell wall biosynthesis